jgi:hypothetical protein
LRGTSAATTTAATPGRRRASAVSTDTIRADGTVERTILPCNIPGGWWSAAYDIVPFTLSMKS